MRDCNTHCCGCLVHLAIALDSCCCQEACHKASSPEAKKCCDCRKAIIDAMRSCLDCCENGCC